jgi:hypothetical protein
MPNYEIEFSAFEPVFGKIDFLPANTEGEARDFADDEIASMYPEYTDVEITRVKEILT